MEPNTALRAAREASPSPTFPGEPMTRAELAEAVNAHLWTSTEHRYCLDAHMIARYERGAVRWPNLAYRSALRAVLGAQTDADLGFFPTRRGSAHSCALATPTPASLARTTTSDERLDFVLDDSPTGSHHTVMVRETTDAFRRLDNRFGGAQGFGAINAYVGDVVGPRVVRGHYDVGIRSDFLRAAAELHQLAGWTAYDVGAQSLGRTRLRAALELATEADDDALAAEMLAALGHHAAFSRSAGEAIELALAAQRLARRAGLPALHAESAVPLAHGHALVGDKFRCASAMSQAEKAFSDVSVHNTPSWLRYFDQAYLAARLARTLRELGDPQRAEEFARSSLRMAEGFERGRLFNTALLTTILVDTAGIDEAIHHGWVALDLARRVGSSRARTYLREVSDRLHPLQSMPEAAPLRREIALLGGPEHSLRSSSEQVQ